MSANKQCCVNSRASSSHPSISSQIYPLLIYYLDARNIFPLKCVRLLSLVHWFICNLVYLFGDQACKLQLPDLKSSVMLLVLIIAKSQLTSAFHSSFCSKRGNCYLLKSKQTPQPH